MMSSGRPVIVESHVEGDVLSDLVHWVTDQVNRRAVRFVLLQTGETQPVDEWFVSEMLDTHSLATAIHAVGVREAHTIRESIAYWVYSLRGDALVAASRFPFRVEVGSRWQQAANDSPNERGVIAMLMRHTEGSSKVSVGYSHKIIEQYEKLLEQGTSHLSRLLEQAYARIDLLETREAGQIEMRDQLMTVVGEREVKLEEVRRKTEEDRRKDERQKLALKGLAPIGNILMARLLGQGQLPGANGPTEAAARIGDDLIDDLIASMTNDQVAQMLGVLRPEQIALFEQIYDLSNARIHRRETANPASGVAT
ncbi:MAG: hypothetical protein ACHREM_25090, partial [Polyangiales bacterium]